MPGPASISRTRPGVGRRFHRAVVLRPQLALEHVDLAGREAQQLRVLIRDDLERQPIQIGQLHALRVAAPVPRIAREDDALARLVALEHEGTESGHLLRVGGRPPGGLERPVGQRLLEDVPRVDRQRVEDTGARRERGGEREHDAMRGEHLHRDRLVVHAAGRRRSAPARRDPSPPSPKTPRRRHRTARRPTRPRLRADPP